MSVTMTQNLTDYTDIGILEVAFNKMGSGLTENTQKKVMLAWGGHQEMGVPDFFVNGSNDMLGVFILEDGTLKVEGDVHYLKYGGHGVKNFEIEELKQRYNQSAIEQIMEENGFDLLTSTTDSDNNILLSFAN